MKKVGLTLITALLGGIVAIGGYKFFEQKNLNSMSFEERQKLHFANHPISEITASTGNPDFTQAAALVTPGVVNIKTTYPARSARRSQPSSPFDLFEEFFGTPRQQRIQPSQPQAAQATGSGVIISEDGYIVTNNHVVEGAEKIEVTLTDRRIVEAKIIGRDPNTDIALIKINEKGLPFVKIGDSDQVQIGEWVLAVGYPLGLESTVTAGIVSAKGRSTGIIGNDLLQKQQQEMYRNQGGMDPNQVFINSAIESFIQTDAVINKGNSGGALVNARGELIGINSNIMSPSGYYAGYGFAVPVNLVKKIADDFVKFGEVKRGLIGVTFRALDAATAKELDIKDVNGLYVTDITPGGAAEKAGLKPGDIITKMDNKPIYYSSDLQEKVYRLRPGDKVLLTYKRDGKERDISVTLQEEVKPKAEEKTNSSASATTLFNKLGAGFVSATADKKSELGVNSGVVVTQVHSGGLFQYFNINKGLVITHINQKPVNNVDDIEKALSEGNKRYIHIVGVPQKGSRVEFNIPIDSN